MVQVQSSHSMANEVTERIKKEEDSPKEVKAYTKGKKKKFKRKME